MTKSIKNTFRALRYPNYRVFITGQAISRIGTWMERTAVSWVVYEMTHSTFMLGVTVFASQFPSFLFSLFGGIVADRYNRHRVVMITQILSMIQATILAVIVLLGHAQVWQILTLITTLGIINAFDIPARQTLVHQLVENPEDLSNAVALNSSIVNIARLVGPALSGIVLSTMGAGICFSINALSYLAVIVSLLFLKLRPQEIKPKKQSNFKEIKEGFRYLKAHPHLAPLTIYIGIVSLLVLPFNTLLPEFAKEVFHGDAQTFGYISSCIGSGALIGTIFLASLKGDSRKSPVLLINAAVLGISLILFSQVQNLYLALAIALVAGFTALTQSTICLTIIQTRAAPEMRGRMISLFAMSLFGMLPLGGLIIGWISNQIGSSMTVFIQGILSIIISISFYKFLSNRKKKRQDQKLSEEINE